MVPGGAGCDAAAKVGSIVAGILTGADSIADSGVLREGAVHKVLPGVKAGEGGGGLCCHLITSLFRRVNVACRVTCCMPLY